MTNSCPLCQSDKVNFFIHAKDKNYFRCTICDLIYHKTYLPEKEEKSRYEKHQNHIIDQGYKDFLYQIITPVKERIPKQKQGLDFGSGPFPALVRLLEKEGYKMKHYDPFFYNDASVLQMKYDFITLTEVAEHLYYPKDIFEKLITMLNKDAYLFIMTYRTDNIKDFKNWHYIADDTHLCFYSIKTMQYIAQKYSLTIENISDRVIVLKK